MKKSLWSSLLALLLGGMALAQSNAVPVPAATAAPRTMRGPAVPASPVVQADGRLTFYLRAPNASAVKLIGDYPFVANFHGGTKDTLMAKDEAGNWSVTVGPLKPDIYNYAFEVDGVRVLDPQSVHISRMSAANRVTNWVLVPGPESANYQINDVPHGRVSEVWYRSPSLNNTARRLIVYTPPGYEAGSTRYPVFYLYHGGGEDELTWTVLGRAAQILDNQIAQGKTVPMIVVMPSWNVNSALSPADANGLPGGGQAGLGAPGGQNNPTLYADSVVTDLIPFVDKNYRTIADANHRAVAGTSAGGTQAALTGLRHLESFAWIGLLSPALARVPGAQISIPLPADADSRRGPDLGVSIDPVKFSDYFHLGPEMNRRIRLLYLSVGGAEGLMEEELAGRAAFDAHGVKYTWVTRPGYGHEWAFWRQDLQDFSSQLFRPLH